MKFCVCITLCTESPVVVQYRGVDLEDAVIALSAVPTDPCSSTRVNSVPAHLALRVSRFATN